MKRQYARGLVVGKFCPLHLGHEWLISQAQAACEELIVLSYTDPGFPGYDIEQRESWLKTRFPGVQTVVFDHRRLAQLSEDAGLDDVPPLPADSAPDDEHRYFVAWACTDLLKKTADAVFTSEDYGDGFARVLSRCFAHPVDHICVDKARTNIPVSGSMIRSDPHAFRDYLAPEVYASFVRRIAILGGESSGKTTLAAALAERLNTRWAPEYGRELWDARSGRLAYEDMPRIAQTQVSREEQLAREANRWLICDTTPLTTLFYCQATFGQSPQTLRQLAQRPYDLTLVCAPDFPFVQDGTRQDEPFRSRQHAWYQAQLAERNIQFHLVKGNLQQRLTIVEELINNRDGKNPTTNRSERAHRDDARI